MEHGPVVDAIKTQRAKISQAAMEINRLRSEAMKQIEEESIALRQQLSGLKVSEKEVRRA